jgi:uncharacterized protein YciW
MLLTQVEAVKQHYSKQLKLITTQARTLRHIYTSNMLHTQVKAVKQHYSKQLQLITTQARTLMHIYTSNVLHTQVESVKQHYSKQLEEAVEALAKHQHVLQELQVRRMLLI